MHARDGGEEYPVLQTSRCLVAEIPSRAKGEKDEGDIFPAAALDQPNEAETDESAPQYHHVAPKLSAAWAGVPTCVLESKAGAMGDLHTMSGGVLRRVMRAAEDLAKP